MYNITKDEFINIIDELNNTHKFLGKMDEECIDEKYYPMFKIYNEAKSNFLFINKPIYSIINFIEIIIESVNGYGYLDFLIYMLENKITIYDQMLHESIIAYYNGYDIDDIIGFLYPPVNAHVKFMYGDKDSICIDKFFILNRKFRSIESIIDLFNNANLVDIHFCNEYDNYINWNEIYSETITFEDYLDIQKNKKWNK